MHDAQVDTKIIAQILDWTAEHALQPNGDFYFPEEEPEYQIWLRVYRPLTFLKVAAWVGHPLVKKEHVINRLLQYQHESGGVFNYIGNDPNQIEAPPTLGCIHATFFGHLMIALDMQERALKAGEWLLTFVHANKAYMRDGRMYTQITIDGDLVKDVKPGEKITKVVDNKDPKQEFWQVGTAMAYLAVLYDTMRRKWGYSETEAKPYLEAATTLLEFEKTMPLYTYFWPSKCKVGWGVGELLRVLVEYDKGATEQIDAAYRIAKRVAIHTFMDNQLPNGGWSCMHYPLDETIPEMRFEYKPLKGMVNVPQAPIPGAKVVFLPSEEITGEFLGELKSIEDGLKALLNYYRTHV